MTNRPDAREAAAREQAFDPLARGTRRQRREAVEERRDHRRIQHEHQQLERHPRDPRPRATTTRRRCASATARRTRAAGRARRRRRCPWRGRRATSASVVRLKPKRSSMRNVRHHENGNAMRRRRSARRRTATARRAAIGAIGKRFGRRQQPRESAAERERDEHDRIDHRFEHAEALLGDRVVGRLAVRGDVDPRSRTRPASRRDARARARSAARRARAARASDASSADDEHDGECEGGQRRAAREACATRRYVQWIESFYAHAPCHRTPTG